MSVIRVVGVACIAGLAPVSLRGQPADSAKPVPARFDLVTTRWDANRLPLSPRWGTRVDAGQLDPAKTCGILAVHGAGGHRSVLLRDLSCFSDSTKTILRLFEPQQWVAAGGACTQPIDDGSPGGHLNWYPITLVGSLKWVGSGRGQGGDYDLTYNLYTDRHPPATKYNTKEKVATDSTRPRVLDSTRSAVHIEFDFRETTDRLPGRTGSKWWAMWKPISRGARKKVADSAAALLGVSGRSVVTGLFNLDLVHGGHSELHPVFAMAVLVSEDSSVAGKLTHRWILLARDRGNQGNCAPPGVIPFRLGQTDAPRDSYRFRLGAPLGFENAPTIRKSSSWVGKSNTSIHGPVFHWHSSEGLEVQFDWLKPEKASPSSVVLGEFDVVWTRSAAPSGRAGVDRSDKPLGTQEIMAQSRRFQKETVSAPDAEREGRGGPDIVVKPTVGFDAEYYANLSPIDDDMMWSETVHTDPSESSPDTVSMAATELFDPSPPVVACWQVNKRENPRCRGDWTAAPGFGYVLGGGASASLSFENPRHYFVGPVLRLRYGAEVARKEISGSPTAHRLYSVSLQPTLIAGPFRKVAGLYLLAGPGGGFERTHDRDWRAFYSLMAGAGFGIRTGYLVNANFEFFYKWRGPRGRENMAGVGLQFPFYF